MNSYCEREDSYDTEKSNINFEGDQRWDVHSANPQMPTLLKVYLWYLSESYYWNWKNYSKNLQYNIYDECDLFYFHNESEGKYWVTLFISNNL